MRFPILLTLIAALVGVGVVVAIGAALIRPNQPLILEAGFSLETISPNADGVDDITIFRYRLARNAQVSIHFEAEDGRIYQFRDRQARVDGDYQVEFSGVVDGFVLPDETIAGAVERRLMPDGRYQWVLKARTADGEQAEARGALLIRDGDRQLPTISSFTVAPPTFTPNQDGIDDRVALNVYLDKAADLRVFLIDQNGKEIPISARQEGRKPGEPGRHIFDYEAGIDLNAEPPPDGVYRVVALAQDLVGQRIRVESTLGIQLGGKPIAEIVPQAVGVDVVFDVQPYEERFYSARGAFGDRIPIPDDPASLALTTLTIPLGDMLVFKTTIENYSQVPIRTSGPWPGTVYEQDQLPAAMGYPDESGAWRVGIECQNSMSSFPYRWAIGTEADLTRVEDPNNDNVYYYLEPGRQTVVWGAIHFTRMEERNPQACWAGLIHEDVAVVNNNVGRREIRLVPPIGE